MAAVNSYLNFAGNTEEAFLFYQSVFGGEFATFQRFKEMPGSEQMSAEDKEKIMHVALPIGHGTVLMATDALESLGHKLIAGNNFSLAISAEAIEEAKEIFIGLAAGGAITVPFDKAPWGAYFGMLTDKFGIQWMVNFNEITE